MEKGRTRCVRPSMAFCNYLPSCLAISSAKFGPVRLPPSGGPGFDFSRGGVNPPRRKVLPPAKRLHAVGCIRVARVLGILRENFVRQQISAQES